MRVLHGSCVLRVQRRKALRNRNHSIKLEICEKFTAWAARAMDTGPRALDACQRARTGIQRVRMPGRSSCSTPSQRTILLLLLLTLCPSRLSLPARPGTGGSAMRILLT